MLAKKRVTGLLITEEIQMIENHFNTPTEIIDANMKSGIAKVNLPLRRMILLGMLAGIFIALGGAASNVAIHTITDVGLARVLAGVIFPVGLMMIVFVGGELFTGNCLIAMDVYAGNVKIRTFIKNMCIIFFSNLLGALLIDVLIFFSGQLDYTSGALGAYTIKVAISKVSITPIEGITSGILCNILVCVAILMAGAARDVIGKIFAVFFPIFAFVIGGFEHCVANMYYIPTGMLAAANADYAAKAVELYGITAEQLETLTVAGSLKNFIPVIIGNIIGGAVLVGGMCYAVYKSKKE